MTVNMRPGAADEKTSDAMGLKYGLTIMCARCESARPRREARAIPSGVDVSTSTYVDLSNSKTCSFYGQERDVDNTE
jgi:hypothetical protein